jgi:excinuclease UvrABC nuclease subunit
LTESKGLSESIGLMEKEMRIAAQAMQFEKAAEIRDRLKALKRIALEI